MPKHQRSGCWVLIAGIFTLYQIMSIVTVLQLPNTIQAKLAFPPVLQVALAAVWSVVFFVAGWRLIKHRPRAAEATAGLIVLFIVYSMLRLVLFTQSDYDSQRLPVLVVFFSMLVIVFSIALWQMRSAESEVTTHDS